MIYKLLIPIAILSVLSITFINAVTSSNQIEYFDHNDYSGEHVVGQYNPKKIKNRSQADKSLLKEAKIDRPRFYQKTESVVEKDIKVAAAQKAEAKKQEAKNPQLAKTTVTKTKNRKPSQVDKKQSTKKKKTTAEKFQVPENLPPVAQPIFYSSGVPTNYQNTSGSPQVSVGGQTNGNGSSAGNPVFIIPGNTTTIPVSEDSILLTREGVETINNEYAKTIMALAPQLKQRVRDEFEKAIFDHVEGYENFEILEYKSFDFNLADSPVGINTFGKDSLILSLPRSGMWNMQIKLKVHYENDIFSTTEDINFYIKNLSLSYPFKVVHTTEGKVYFYEALTPIYKYDISFDSSSFLTNVLFEMFHLFMPNYFDDSIALAVERLQMDVKSLVNKTKLPVQNINSAYIEAPTANLDEIITNIDQKINDKHMYHDTVHSLIMKKTNDKTWAESYTTNGEGIDGEVETVNTIQDSAKWSGHHLASQSFKYSLNTTPENLASVKKSLSGIDKLFKVHQYTGLLARSITPLDSPLAQKLISENYNVGSTIIIGTFDNQQWLAMQGENGISRDQYSGVLFGLATAYDLVNDETVKTKCKFLVKKIMGYLESHHYIFENDRLALTTANSNSGPSIWQGANHFKLIYLTIAAHMLPELYQDKLDDLSDLANSAWISAFFNVVDPFNNYKKFHLDYTDLYTYFRLETNPARKAQMEKVAMIYDYYLGHHRNIYFDTITASIFPNKVSNKLNNMKVGLYKFLKRSHRHTRQPDIDMTSVTTVEAELPTGQVVTMAKESLHPEYRDLASESVWDKSAHHLETNDDNNSLIESIGLDATLPYWMAKYHQFY